MMYLPFREKSVGEKSFLFTVCLQRRIVVVVIIIFFFCISGKLCKSSVRVFFCKILSLLLFFFFRTQCKLCLPFPNATVPIKVGKVRAFDHDFVLFKILPWNFSVFGRAELKNRKSNGLESPREL